MNEKVCKKLRRVARDSTVGQPARELVRFKQRCSPARDKDGKSRVRYAECAVNAPGTTREVYRSLKHGGRRINPASVVRVGDANPPKVQPRAVSGDLYTRATPTPEKAGMIAQAKEKTRLFFRRFRKQS